MKLIILKKFFSPKLRKTFKVGKKRRRILFYNPTPFRAFIFGIGSALLISSLGYLIFLYLPLVKAFLSYKFGPETQKPPVETKTTQETKIDLEDFYLYIPKIKASAKIFAHIPTNNKDLYTQILQKGIAHAQGSSLPGEGKTIYLFAHSTNTPFNAIRLNAVFMLLNELNNNDQIIIFFNGKRYTYTVFKKEIVNPAKTEYFSYPNDKETLILQTCWPPGTIWKRLLVFASPTQL